MRSARDHVGEQVGRQRHLPTLRIEAAHRHALDVASRRLHVERELTFNFDAVRSRQAHVVGHQSDRRRLQIEALRLPFAGSETHLAIEHRRGRPLGRTSRNGQPVSAGRALDIVQIELETCVIAERQESRSRRQHRHRITHDDVAARAAELVGAPRDRHHPDRSVELRQVEIDACLSVGTDPHDAGELGHRRLDWRATLHRHAAPTVATRPQPARIRMHAVDQPAIEIAQLGAELRLRVEPLLWPRRLVARQIEDADVDRGNRDVGLLVGPEPVELDRHREPRSGADHGWRVERHLERPGRLVEAEPLETDGAARHPLGRHVHRPVEHRRHVRAGAPGSIDPDRNLAAAFRYIDGGVLHEAGAEHRDQRLATLAGGDLELGRVACRVARPVERDVEHLGRIG